MKKIKSNATAFPQALFERMVFAVAGVHPELFETSETRERTRLDSLAGVRFPFSNFVLVPIFSLETLRMFADSLKKSERASLHRRKIRAIPKVHRRTR
jgi:hypothetical protein